MENEKEKLQFFTRIKKSIVNLEKYSDFVNEKLSTTIKFLCLFVFIYTVFQTGIYGIRANEMIDKVAAYVESSLKDFEFVENKLSADGVSTAYDEESDFYFAMDTEGEVNTYRDEMKKHSMGMVFTAEDAYVYTDGNEYIYTYSQLLDGADTSEALNKEKLLGAIKGDAKVQMLTSILIAVLLMNYPTTLFAYTLQGLAVALAVFLTGKIMGIKLNFKGSFSIAVYSMVLSSIFAVVYAIINNFSEFRIVNFDLMYNIIIYIYAMFAVFMLKIDDIKQKEEIVKEVRKIEKVQEEVHQEMTAAKEENLEKEVVEETEKVENEEKIEKNEEIEEVVEEEKIEEKSEIEELTEEKEVTKEEVEEEPIKEIKKSKGKKK